jgi:teichoic acid transport system permease protein
VFISTSKVITDSLPLIRALQFPRAALPLAYVMIELQQLALSMAVLVVLVIASPHEPVTWNWLLAVPALALLTVFNAGLAFFAARTGARINDFAQLLPFLMRTWLYVSGVIYSVQQVVAAYMQNYAWATTLLQVNPAAIYLALVRNALLETQRASAFGAQPYDAVKCHAWAAGGKYAQAHPTFSSYCHPTFVSSHLWLFGAGWAIVMLLLGFWYFWRKEVFYGRG